MKKVLAVALSSTLIACSTPGDYYSAAVQHETLRTSAQSDYALAMLKIAGEDPTAKVAAIVALALTQQRGAPLQPIQSEALQWASIIAPIAGMGLQGYFGYKLGVTQSDNATSIARSTNAAFAGMAQQINDPTVVYAPQPVVVKQPAPILIPPADPVIIQPSYPPVQEP